MHMPVKRQRVSDPSAEGEFILDGSKPSTERTLQLNQGESIVVVGEGALVVEQGCVVVNGFLLTEKDQKTSLRCDEGYPIWVQSSGGAAPEEESELKGPYVSARYALVRLESAPDSGTTLRILKLSKDACNLFYPKEWVEVSDDIVTHLKELQNGLRSVICICGAKNTGKSSFCRYLVNALLRDHKTVQYLDMDCGQPEFTPPGMVSLVDVVQPILEPPYLQTAVPCMSHFVGDISPASDTPMYVKLIDSLYRYACRKENVIVVNTNGWIQGLGVDVLRQCLSGMAITHLVRFHGDNPRGDVIKPVILSNDKDDQPLDYVLPAISCAAPSCVAARELRNAIASDDIASMYSTKVISAVEKRQAQWSKFCLQCCNEVVTSTRIFSDDIALQLATQKPYCISLGDIDVLPLFNGLDISQTACILNGSIVGLYSLKKDGKGHLQVAGEDALIKCHGMGIVRSVAPDANLLYLVTPIPEKSLSLVNCLVIGKLDLPSNLLQTNGLKSPYLAIHGLSADGTAAGQGKSRNNLQRQRA
jgi:polynucleotide 5'-hydroxyl-kinase GRC3/NOL9